MLEALRKSSKSWFIKILFAMLIVSFGAWGVGDFVSKIGKDDTPIKVGAAKVSMRELQKEFDREITRLRPMFGGKLTSEQARQLGLLNRTIEQIVSRSLIEQEAHGLGLKVGEEELRRTIANTPAFLNEKGVFDRLLYQQTLQNNNFSEKDFVALLRRDLERGQIVGSIAASTPPPAVLTNLLYAYRKERREVEAVLISADAQPSPAQPDAQTLAEFHKAGSGRYTAPEYRSFSLVSLKLDDLLAEIKVPAKAVEEAYEQRRDEMQSPEKRQVEQILFDSEEKARQAADLLGQGRDFYAVAKEVAGLEKDTLLLGAVEKRDLPPEIGGQVFALALNKPSEPVKSQLGWHIFRVGQIDNAKGRPLAEVKDQLSRELAREMAEKALYQLATKVEDEIGGGARLEEAAKRLALKVIRIEAIDSKGLNADGKKVDALPGGKFLETVFATPEGADSAFTESEDWYWGVKVEKVTPPSLRPFEQVQAKVLADWMAEQKMKTAREAAEEAAAKLKNKSSLAEAAKAKGAKVKSIPSFTREADGEPVLPPQLVAEMFREQPGHVASAATKEGVIIARLVKITPPNAKQDAEGATELRQSLEQAMAADRLDALTQSLSARLGVRIDLKQVDAFFARP
jgi:peptidyl-prolyl cis-trans isomerase D